MGDDGDGSPRPTLDEDDPKRRHLMASDEGMRDSQVPTDTGQSWQSDTGSLEDSGVSFTR